MQLNLRKKSGWAVLAAAVAVPGVANGTAYYANILCPLVVPNFGTVQVSNGNQFASGGQAVGYGSGAATGNNNHGLLWTAASGAVDFNPTNLAGFTTSFLNGTNGSQQVGAGYGSATGGSTNDHALLWNGTAGSAVDLNPSALTQFRNSSSAVATSGNQQVGYANGVYGTFNYHAVLWSGNAASAVDLHPTSLSGFLDSDAQGTDGIHQVGYGVGSGTGSRNHALLWAGTASSAVDLHPTVPSGLDGSEACAVSGNQQVGYDYGPFGGFGEFYHAMIWSGTAASAVDLNPTLLSGFTSSYAYGTNGSQQVGYAIGSTKSDAIVWSGTPGSAADLESTLPSSGSWTSSKATAIDSSGNIFGSANGTYLGYNSSFSVEWSAVVPVTVAANQVYHFSSSLSTGVWVRQLSGLTLGTGAKAIADSVTNQANRQLLVISGSGLSLAGTTAAWSAKLDLGSNDLDLPGASLASVADQVRQGLGAGNWNGTGGITSSVLAADSNHLLAIGVISNSANGVQLFSASNLFDGTAPGAGDVLVKYTYLGDANLDGKVDGGDYSRLDSGYLTHATGWYNGDFNYDNVINGSDYTLADNVFNRQGASLNASLGNPQSFTTATIETSPDTALVPEPGMLSVVVTCAVLGFRRPKKR